MRAAVERVAVRALLSTLRIPPQPPLLLLLLSRMMSSPAPCGGVQPRHKHWLLGPANHVMVSRADTRRMRRATPRIARKVKEWHPRSSTACQHVREATPAIGEHMATCAAAQRLRQQRFAPQGVA